MYLYKRIILFSAVFCLFSFLYADNIQTDTTEAIVQPSINQSTVEKLYKIRMFFCNDWVNENKLTLQANLQARPWQEKNLCFLTYNQLNKKVNITITFNEWKKYWDQVACWNIPQEDKFIPLIKNISGWMFPLSLSPEEQVVHNFKIKIPQNSTGKIYWCVYFTIDGSANKLTGAIFQTIIRKYMPIIITITWKVYNFWWRDDIMDTYESSILKIIIGILALWIIITVFKTDKKKTTHHKKK